MLESGRLASTTFAKEERQGEGETWTSRHNFGEFGHSDPVRVDVLSRQIDPTAMMGGVVQEKTMSLNGSIQTMLGGLQTQVPAPTFGKLGEMFHRLHVAGVAEHPPAVGSRAPEVSLEDTTGRTIRLSDLYTAGPLVLLFYRGGWCPFCDLTLRAFDAIHPKIKEIGGQLVAVSPQTAEATVATGESRALTFDLLRDPANAAARAFGLDWQLTPPEQDLYRVFNSDLEVANGNKDWKLPAPAAFVIDRQGTVAFSWADSNWTHRAEPDDVLAALQRTVQAEMPAGGPQ